MKYKIGQRVRAIAPFDDNYKIVGVAGTIQEIDQFEGRYGVEFDKMIDGHDLGDWGYYDCPDECGWYCDESVLIPLTLEKLVGLEDFI